MNVAKSVAASTEEYLGAVSEHLAIHGVSPDRVGQHLEEIAGHLAASGASPVAEFGPPEVIAHRLATAERPTSSQWARIAALAVGLTGWALAFFLLLGGSDTATLSGVQLGGVAIVATIAAFGFSTTGARFRDRIAGVSKSEPGASWVDLGRIVGLVLCATALSVAIELLVGPRSVGMESVRSWVAGLTLVTLLIPVTWWAYRRNLGRPKFPVGSPLRASHLTRQVRVDGQGAEGWRARPTSLQGFVPMAGMLALIVSARWLSEPFDLFALVAAVLVGPGWVFWLSRSRTAKTGPATD